MHSTYTRTVALFFLTTSVYILPSGLLDQTFGTQGITLTSVGTNAQINSLALQQNGNIIAAGTSDDSAAIARYFVA